jgi:hypothetical protein
MLGGPVVTGVEQIRVASGRPVHRPEPSECCLRRRPALFPSLPASRGAVGAPVRSWDFSGIKTGPHIARGAVLRVVFPCRTVAVCIWVESRVRWHLVRQVVRRSQDQNPTPQVQGQQVLVARHDRGSLGCRGQLQIFVVRRISTVGDRDCRFEPQGSRNELIQQFRSQIRVNETRQPGPMGTSNTSTKTGCDSARE